MVAEHRATCSVVAGPSSAGRVRGTSGERSVRIAASQNVVASRRHGRAFFRERRLTPEGVPFAVQFTKIRGDAHSGGVDPGSFADAIAGVDGRARRRRRSAEIGTPSMIAVAGVLREPLAVVVGPRQSAKVAAETASDARHEERHRRRRRTAGLSSLQSAAVARDPHARRGDHHRPPYPKHPNSLPLFPAIRPDERPTSRSASTSPSPSPDLGPNRNRQPIV